MIAADLTFDRQALLEKNPCSHEAGALPTCLGGGAGGACLGRPIRL